MIGFGPDGWVAPEYYDSAEAKADCKRVKADIEKIKEEELGQKWIYTETSFRQ
jgi:hypothetical protein